MEETRGDGKIEGGEKSDTIYTQPTNMAPLKPYGAYAIYISNIKHVNGNRTHTLKKIIQFDDVAVAFNVIVYVFVLCTLICEQQQQNPF